MNKMQKYTIEALMTAFLLLFIFWAIGYFANAIYGMKFELQSCWGGVAAIGSAGVLAAIKYIMDSCRNSPNGQLPYDSGAKAIDALEQSAVNMAQPYTNCNTLGTDGSKTAFNCESHSRVKDKE